MNEIRRLCLKVHGRVQGVFYRQSTRDKARMLGLTGFVRNESDGTVAVDAYGPTEQLERLLDWCKTGPPSAEVTDVEVAWFDGQNAPGRFDILH